MDCINIEMNDSYRAERTYICNVVFQEFLGIAFNLKFTTITNHHYEIAYDNKTIRFPDVLFSCPEDEWLLETSFPKLPLTRIQINKRFFESDIPVIYGAKNTEKLLEPNQIDLLGSIFFMLTRYEEAKSPHHDQFGRYDHEHSISHKEGLLRRPIVNEYLEILKDELKKIAPQIGFKKHTYTLSLSHDVDVPMTLHCSFGDFLKKSAGDLYLRKSPQLLLQRINAKLHYLYNSSFRLDPNNTFEFLTHAEQKAGVRSLFNFIPVSGKSPYDSKYDINHPFILSLFKHLSEREFEIGFHPSYDSFENARQTQKEMNILNRCLEKINVGPVQRGRQHYLRWRNPATWQIWDDIGMKEDGSVGFGMTNGFRAGCAYKYSVFDLSNKKQLKLLEEPLVVMDVNSNVDSKPETVLEEVDHFSKTCRFFDGNFTVLYHNNYVLNRRQKEVYLEILEIAT